MSSCPADFEQLRAAKPANAAASPNGRSRQASASSELDRGPFGGRGFVAEQSARRVETLVVSERAFWERPEDRLKVWPTNHDRPAFNAVIADEALLPGDASEQRLSKMAGAHQYFADRARQWLTADG
jgi:hypothetical protein